MDEVVPKLLASPDFARVMDCFREEIAGKVDGLKKDVSLMREKQSEVQASLAEFEGKMRANRRELDTSLRKVEKDSSRLSGYVDQIKDISGKVDEITTELQLKATQKEISAVENRFNFVCTASVAQRMQLAIDEKATIAAVDGLKDELQQLKTAISEEYCLKTDLKDELKRVSQQWTEQVALLAKEDSCARRGNEADKAVKLLNKNCSLEHTALAHKIAEVTTALNQFDSHVRSKPSFADISSLKQTIDGFCTKADLAEVKKEVEVVLDTWAARIDDFSDSIAGQEHVLARYDEVLLDKASKVDFIELSTRLKVLSQLGIEDHLNGLGLRTKEAAEACRALTDRVVSAEGSVADAVVTAKGLKCDRKDIAFLKERVVDMEEQLLMKADKVDLIQSLDRKASCEDVQTTLQSIDILHRLLKMSAVLVNHTLKGLFSKCSSDSKPLDPGKREWLLKHSEIIVKWANDFSPLQTGNKVPEEMFIVQPPSPMVGRSPTPEVQMLSDRRPLETEEYPATSSRRECFSLTIPEDTSDTNISEEPMTTSHRSRCGSNREESKAVANAIRALQNTVKSLQGENQKLKETIVGIETKGESDRDVWKKRLIDEVGISKDREMDLIAKFQKLDVKLKEEAKRIKKAESAFKDAEAELTVKLEKALAENSTLEMRCRKLESDYKAVLAEKEEFEQQCEANQAEIQALKGHIYEKPSTRTSEPLAFSPTFEDLDAVEAPSHPAPTTGFIDEIRREIQEARESASRPRSLSQSTHEPHINRYLQEKQEATPEPSSTIHRSSSLLTFKQDKSTDRYNRSYMEFSRLISLPTSPIIFNPAKSSRLEHPRVSFQAVGKPVRASPRT